MSEPLPDIERALRSAADAGTWHAGLGSPLPEAPEMAAIVRECCCRFRPELVGQLVVTPDGASFTVTSAMTGSRFRVTVAEDQP